MISENYFNHACPHLAYTAYIFTNQKPCSFQKKMLKQLYALCLNPVSSSPSKYRSYTFPRPLDLLTKNSSRPILSLALRLKLKD